MRVELEARESATVSRQLSPTPDSAPQQICSGDVAVHDADRADTKTSMQSGGELEGMEGVDGIGSMGSTVTLQASNRKMLR